MRTLSRMPDDYVDLIVTSPPYNKNAYAKSYGDNKSWRNMRGRQIAYDVYSDDMPAEEYANWQKKVIKECLRVLKPTGSLFYNHKDIIVNGCIIPPKFVYDFPIHQQIVWNRKSSVANDPHYFQPVTEYVYWFVKDPKQFRFDKSKAVCRQSVWSIPFEVNTPHPAPFPEMLVGNILLCTTNEGDLVYDPFMGSGTTAVVAERYKRNYVGSEISPNYFKLASDRLKRESKQLSLWN